MNNMYSRSLVFLFILAVAFCANEKTNDTCSIENDEDCIKVVMCPYVLNLIINNDLEKIKKLKCGFEGNDPKVCCPKINTAILYNVTEDTATNRPQILTTLKPRVTSTIPLTYKMEQTDNTFPNKSVCGKYSAVSNRIVGGSITQIDEHPWLARLQYKIDDRNVFGCSGALITDRYILTAAHCVSKYKPTAVRLGEWNSDTDIDCHNKICNEPTVNVNVTSITIHPKYDGLPQAAFHDIALIQLQESVEFTDFIQPICLPVSEYIALQDYSSDSVYFTAGWGLTEFESESAVKRQVQLNAARIEICRVIYNFNTKSEPNIICAGGIKGKDTCKGDSGGPLIKLVSENYEVNWYLFGITSYGSSICGSEGVPGLYTRVSAYMNWIRGVIT